MVCIALVCAGAQTVYADQFETQIGEEIDYDVSGDGENNWWDWLMRLFDPYLVGDADNDGDVDLTDYSIVRSYIANGGYDGIDQQADVNDDGAIDAFDLFEIEKWISTGEQTVEYK